MKVKKTIKQGFSFIEAVVVLSILGILCYIALMYYGRLKDSSVSTWAKAEMGEVIKIMRTAKSYDGYYHQFIYSMGYRPKGKVLASVGTAASSSTICCNKYPNPGASPCSKNYRSGFLYFNCKSSASEIATDNVEICNSAGYSNTCLIESGLNPLQTSNFSYCSISPTSWCNCNAFIVGAITHFDKELTIDHTGTLCLED